jgi:hypothetical protein
VSGAASATALSDSFSCELDPSQLAIQLAMAHAAARPIALHPHRVDRIGLRPYHDELIAQRQAG